MKNYTTTLLAGLLMSSPLCADEWKPLFNGKDTTGWEVVGDAAVGVADGILTGKQKTAKGGNLLTVGEYDNFELRFSYKIDWPANSGIWFRFNDEKGYQFDILKYKKPVAFSGTLYCPGKLFITSNLDESLENKDDWNEGRIYANGTRLILWLNGHQVGDTEDSTLSKGKIGIQIHGGKEFTSMGVHIRKMEIRPLKPGDAPSSE